jgi:hypothetical protein
MSDVNPKEFRCDWCKEWQHTNDMKVLEYTYAGEIVRSNICSHCIREMELKRWNDIQKYYADHWFDNMNKFMPPEV